jgi:dolichyl-phosphate beta-glucosyltransferase
MQKACIVVPCYNEAERLLLGEFTNFLDAEPGCSFLFVDDGSADDTLRMLKVFETLNQRVQVLSLPTNCGKAEAVRQGIIKAAVSGDFSYLGYWDADLATPLSEIPYFISQVRENSKKLGMGSRMRRLGAVVERRPLRHLLGRIFSTFSSLILKLPVYDTQCGAKILSAELVHLFEEKFISTWLFDVEVLARYRNHYGLDRALCEILEIPVNSWMEKEGSKLKLKHIIRVPLELIRIHFNYKKS